MVKTLMTNESSFSQFTYELFQSNVDCTILTVSETIERMEWKIEYSYARKIIAFVRQLQNGCFDSLPDGVQRAIIWIEDNHADDMQNKDISDKLGVSNYHIRLAKLFITMENMGLFDKPGVYDF
jgi:hypothetical protein